MKLSETKADSQGTIVKIGGDPHFLNRIVAIGITKGMHFKTVRDDRKMPLLVFCHETLIALNRVDAERIEVSTA